MSPPPQRCVCMYVYKQHGTGVRACVCAYTNGRTDDAYRRLSLSTDVTGAEKGGGGVNGVLTGCM